MVCLDLGIDTVHSDKEQLMANVMASFAAVRTGD